jgi:hypothetical protein
MLTGIEVAGLILSIFPLVISGLEHYKEGFETLHGWWMYRTDYLEFLRKIGVQSVLFQANLEELLGPIVESEALLHELMRNPRSPAWNNEQLEKRLRKQLPTSYDWYRLTVEEMHKDLKRLKERLNIRGDKVSYTFF